MRPGLGTSCSLQSPAGSLGAIPEDTDSSGDLKQARKMGGRDEGHVCSPGCPSPSLFVTRTIAAAWFASDPPSCA
jgi:hypothetical protein